MSNQAAVYPTAKSRFEVRNIQKHRPEKDEVLIKVCFAATNPVDWKIQKHGAFVKNFPTVLSSDVSGVIEEAGEGVDPTLAGQKVWAYLPLIATNFNIRNGGFQQFTVCPKSSVCKLPENLSMEEGATLGLAGATAGIGLFYDLQIPEPTEHEKKEMKGDILLVWGGSSAVGGYAVQLASLAGLTVFAVTSPKNFDLVKKFGATEAFDYHDPEITAKIKKAGGGKIRWVFNSISDAESIQKSAEILENKGMILTTLSPPEDLKLPQGVQLIQGFVGKIFQPQYDEFRNWFFNWFNEKLAAGKVVPTKPEVVATGLEHAQDVIDYHAKGVSATKPILKIC